MKKIITTMLVGAMLTTGFAFAYTDCRDGGQCTAAALADLCWNAPTSVSDKISACKQAVEMINKKITDYKNQDTSSSCQKITNKIMLKAKRMNDADVNGDISRLQKFLKQKGYITYEPDGEFGKFDRNAVWKFQQDNMKNISPTGDVGALTMAKINSMICNSQNNSITCNSANQTKVCIDGMCRCEGQI